MANKGLVIDMNEAEKTITLNKGGKIEEKIEVGKKIFTQKPFEVGDEISYEMKGKNFNFIRKISSIEKENNRTTNNRRVDNKNNGNTGSKVNKLFSYPYNFVSLGDAEKINRKTVKNGENRGNLSGKLKCSLTNITPLFMGSGVSTGNDHKTEMILKDNGNYIIQASSLKGEIRNIIEVVTNSCIKNVETDRLEKREQAGERTNIFGLIKRLPNEKTGEAGLIVEAVKVKIHRDAIDNRNRLPGFYPIKVNKSIMNYVDKPSRKKYRRGEKDPDAINDFYTFDKVIKDGTEDAILWVSADIFGKEYEKILVKKDFVEKGKGRNFLFPLTEYEDLKYLITQRNERDKEERDKKKKIDRQEIQINDPIIFEEDGKNAINLAFSEIPRLRYKYSPYSLIPKEFQPCSSLDNLCFACRLFGTTGNSNEEKKSNDMTSYMGRVFISDAKCSEKKEKLSEVITMKPLGEPHPSLARFYLNGDNYDNNGAKIRGRKFYWHHSDKIKAGENYKKYLDSITTEEKAKYNSSLSFLKPNNIFEFEVEFKNLTEEELGVLIYSLELEDGMLHKFGKAKAFGFGSSKIEIKEFLLKSQNRYSDFTISYEKGNKEKYIDIAKQQYILNDRKEIKELQAILSKENSLDFSKSPFPESYIYNKKTGEINQKRGYNTLNWFTENKDAVLPRILDYSKKK